MTMPDAKDPQSDKPDKKPAEGASDDARNGKRVEGAAPKAPNFMNKNSVAWLLLLLLAVALLLMMSSAGQGAKEVTWDQFVQSAEQEAFTSVVVQDDRITGELT